MISEFLTEWWYWVPLIFGVGSICYFFKITVFDFRFMILIILGQYAIHSLLAFGLRSVISGFCLSFLFVFLISNHIFGGPRKKSDLPEVSAPGIIDADWIYFSKMYLVLYYSARLIYYPFFSGELLLDERLAAQQQNQLIFNLGLAVQPAIAACMYYWFICKRFGLSDWAVVFLCVVGGLGSGSKASVIPLFLTYIGVSSYLGMKPFLNPLVLVSGAVVSGVAVIALFRFFPGLDFEGIASLVGYRLAANTDSLEYIYSTGINPSEYPFSGFGALFPDISKRFGFIFEYPPGVWLHGIRFGNWDGFGPNSGIVMDYFGNLGWPGLMVGCLLGAGVAFFSKRLTAVRCSFLSILSFAVVDVGVFEVAILFWFGVFIALLLLRLGLGARFGGTYFSGRNSNYYPAVFSRGDYFG